MPFFIRHGQSYDGAVDKSARNRRDKLPSPEAAHDSREQLCLAWPDRRRFIWCEFLAVRATPFKASCGLAPSFLAEAPHPRTSSSWPKREGSQVAWQLGSDNRVESWLVSAPSCRGVIPEFVVPLLQCSWPGRRVGLCCEAT